MQKEDNCEYITCLCVIELLSNVVTVMAVVGRFVRHFLYNKVWTIVTWPFCWVDNPTQVTVKRGSTVPSFLISVFFLLIRWSYNILFLFDHLHMFREESSLCSANNFRNKWQIYCSSSHYSGKQSNNNSGDAVGSLRRNNSALLHCSLMLWLIWY